MHFQKKKPERIRFLGRVGLHYFSGNKIYFVDSELASAKDFDLIFYGTEVGLVENDHRTRLQENDARKILEEVKAELWNIGLRFRTSERAWH